MCFSVVCRFVFQAEDGIRDLVRSRGLGDVYKRQDIGAKPVRCMQLETEGAAQDAVAQQPCRPRFLQCCLLYTSDAADERSSVDLGGRRIIKKKKEKRLARSSH